MSVIKVYLNFPLCRVPLNVLVRVDNVFYRRGRCDRSTHEIQLCVEDFSNHVKISFVPCSSLVQYYKEA